MICAPFGLTPVKLATRPLAIMTFHARRLP